MARIHDDWEVTRVPLSGKTQPSRRILSLTRMGARKQPTIMAALEHIEARVASMFAPEWSLHLARQRTACEWDAQSCPMPASCLERLRPDFPEESETLV